MCCIKLSNHPNLNQLFLHFATILLCHHVDFVALLLFTTLLIIGTHPAIVAAPATLITIKMIVVTNIPLFHAMTATMLATMLFCPLLSNPMIILVDNHSCLPHPPPNTVYLSQILKDLIILLSTPIQTRILITQYIIALSKTHHLQNIQTYHRTGFSFHQRIPYWLKANTILATIFHHLLLYWSRN